MSGGGETSVFSGVKAKKDLLGLLVKADAFLIFICKLIWRQEAELFTATLIHLLQVYFLYRKETT